MKWTYEFNDAFLKDFVEPSDPRAPKARENLDESVDGRAFFVLVAERKGDPSHHIGAEAEPNLRRVWLRVTKRGNVYDFYTSLDGERFIKHGSTDWGRSGPKKIGLIAQNGGDSDATDIDAQFDFFELRAR